MADRAGAAAGPLPLDPRTMRDPNSRNAVRDKIFFDTIRRLLTLAYQQAWKRATDLANPDAPAVRAEDCPFNTEPLEDSPIRGEEWRPANDDDSDSYERILQDITQWVAVRTVNTPVLWETLSGKLHVHWSNLPDGLPRPISRQSQQEVWRRLFPDFRGQSQTTQKHFKIKRGWHFFRKNLQLFATLALAEKAAGTTAEENTAATTPVYRNLAAEMEGDPALTLLAEKMATGTANLTDFERFYACLPTPMLAEPGHTQEIRQMREDRKVKEDEQALAEREALIREENELVDTFFTQDIFD